MNAEEYKNREKIAEAVKEGEGSVGEGRRHLCKNRAYYGHAPAHAGTAETIWLHDQPGWAIGWFYGLLPAWDKWTR